MTGSHFDDKDLICFSAKLRYIPSTRSEILLNYSKTKIDDGGSPFKIDTKENIRNIDNEPTNDYIKMDNDLLSLKVKHTEDNYNFTSVTAYAKESVLKNDYVAILGGLSLDFDIDIVEISQELRLNYNFKNVDWLIGAFYSDKTKFNYIENQTLLTLYPSPVKSLNSLQNPDENTALFTQVKYNLDNHYSRRNEKFGLLNYHFLL